MARNFLTPIDMNKNAINNPVAQVLGTAPGSPLQGQFYYDSASANFVLVYNGSAWINPLARANHTGTQLSATISDLASNSLSFFAAPTANLAMAAHKITGLSAPTATGDAATWDYVNSTVQSAAAGISSKDPVNAVATTNQASLTGLAVTVDGVALNTIGMRVLLTGQTTASANGVYVVASGAWARSTVEGGTQGELDNGAMWLVLAGTTYIGTQWRLATTAVVVGTTAVVITQFSAASIYSAGNGILFTGAVISAVPAATGSIPTAIITPTAAAGGLTVAAAGLAVDGSVVRKYFVNIGDGSTTAIVVTHGLGTRNVTMQCYRATTPWDLVECDMAATSTTTATFTFTTAPTTNQFNVVIHG